MARARGAEVGGEVSPSVVDAGLAAGLAVVGGCAFLSAFRGEDLLEPVVVAAVVGVVASVLGAGVLRRGMGFSALLAAVGLGVAAAVVCDASPGVFVSGVVDGPWTILTSAVPVRAEAEVLVVPFAVAGAAGFLGAEVAQRSRFPVAPVAPSLVALVAGLLFGIDDRLPPLWVPSLWVGLALLSTGWRTSREAASTLVTASTVVVEAADDPRRPRGAHASSDDDGGPPRRSAANVLRAVVVVIVVAVPVAWVARWVGPRLPGADQRERFALRELVDQPAQPEPLTNPLVEVTALQGGPDDPLFTAETSAPVERWRLAVLDTYDGREWRSQGAFLPAGVELSGPPDDGSGDDHDEASPDDGQRVTQDVEVADGLSGLWLPVADRVVEIDAGRELLFDAATGVLLVDGNRLPGRYSAVSEVPRPDAGRLAGAAAADDEEARAALALPGEVPDDVAATVEQITRGTASAYDQAVAIERFLAAGTGDDAFHLAVQELPSGHTLGHLRCLLFAADQCARRGSTEQFVAAFALLARTAGLPARVVVGFDGAGSSGRDQVTAHEATAWAEVKFAGIGWVPFDPVPDPTVETTPPTTALPGSSGGTPDSQPATTVAQNAGDQPGDDQDDDGADESSSSGTTVLWGAGVGAAVVLLVLLPGVLRKLRRRRRRRAASPAARVAGAWAAAVEELRRGGLRLTRGLAVSDVVGAGRQRFAGAAEPLGPLGTLVNRAEFSRAEPGPAEADQAWQLSDAFATQRRKGRPPARRLREYFTLS